MGSSGGTEGGSSAALRVGWCIAVALVVLLLPVLAACGGRADERFRVGVATDVAPLGHVNMDSGELEGFEVDLAHELAERLYGSRDALVVGGVSLDTREGVLDDHEVDAVIARCVTSGDRGGRYLISTSYYTEGIGFLVRRGSSFKGLADLDGRTVGVISGSSLSRTLLAEAKARGVTLVLSPYSSYTMMKVALEGNVIDAVACTPSVALSLASRGLRFLTTDVASQSYGVLCSSQDGELMRRINDALIAMRRDGTLQRLKEKWGLASERRP